MIALTNEQLAKIAQEGGTIRADDGREVTIPKDSRDEVVKVLLALLGQAMTALREQAERSEQPAIVVQPSNAVVNVEPPREPQIVVNIPEVKQPKGFTFEITKPDSGSKTKTMVFRPFY